MYEFLETWEKKRAFKKALSEVIKEKPEPLERKVAAPVEASAPEAPKPITPAPVNIIKNPLRKPETTAIDLKYFKDWRHVERVRSNNPLYARPSVRRSTDDDFAQPAIEFPGGNFGRRTPAPEKTLTNNDIMERFAIKPRETTANRDFKTFIAETLPKPKEEPKPEPKPEPKVEQKVKVEVVDLKPKEAPKPAAAKPATKRKPRGKGKRRFDADIISSVGWK